MFPLSRNFLKERNTVARQAKYRERLPQLGGGLFLTDGGLETRLIFREGWELPRFEAFVLLNDLIGRMVLRAYFDRYVLMAIEAGAGFILESPTWRANSDWGKKLGYGAEALQRINRAAIEMMLDIRYRHETSASPMVVSGCIGPRGDGYAPGALMRPDEACDYHRPQVLTFRDAGADLVSAFTMTNIGEAQGIALAAKAANMPCVISFTVETTGRLPAGESLAEAIKCVDDATDKGPAYYMINCAHPTHFDHVLNAGETWIKRLRGLRANSSRMSHAELDNAPELDIGDPLELGGQYADLRRRFPHINVLGGCCGTDHRHVDCISTACRGAAQAA
jgi:S-methylmethionine-dependent homocysteine/selenocysteine methylase